jgi:DNA-directed RNA polymerase specialized sigma24 family protein
MSVIWGEYQRATLQDVFVSGYDVLLKRLSRQLGSVHIASDGLQETFLHAERISNAGAIERPDDYLFRIAAVVEGRQDLEILDQALQKLSPRMRHVFSAVMVERQADCEIVAELGVSYGQSRST